jgi:hypothetical protein
MLTATVVRCMLRISPSDISKHINSATPPSDRHASFCSFIDSCGSGTERVHRKAFLSLHSEPELINKYCDVDFNTFDDGCNLDNAAAASGDV